MLEYVEHIIPYVRNVREMLYTKTVIIMDNFKGQVTVNINELLQKPPSRLSTIA